MMPAWLQIVLTILSNFIAAFTLYWRINVQRKSDDKANSESRKKEIAGIQEAISSIQKEFTKSISDQNRQQEKAIADLRLEFQQQYQAMYEKVDERRRKDVQDLHCRMDDFQGDFATSVIDRIGKLEGSVTSKMESMQNTLSLIQRHFIENGGKE